jgi:hypothetical protein
MKKTPASLTLAGTATKGPNETPKGSGPRIPVPLVQVDADAIYQTRGLTPKASGPTGASPLEARVVALEKALSVVLVHLPAAFFDAQAAADAKTKKVLSDLENRLAAGATLARVLLPEEAHDEALEAWEALPVAAPARYKAANRMLAERLVGLGLASAEEVGI